MSTRQAWRPRLSAVLAAAILASSMEAAAEPTVTLKVPPFPSAAFANFSSVVLPPSGYNALEIWLEGALAEIQASTVRVTLNGLPMTPFVSVNPLPAGMRAVVKLGLSLSPDYSIKREGESILTFAATDVAGTAYRGQFYLSMDATKPQPELAKTTRPRLQEQGVIAPPQHRPPAVDIKSAWPARTTDRTLSLEAHVTDAEGLRRIVIEVNGRDIEEIVLQNERPVRQQNGRVVRAGVPGRVSGDGRGVQFTLPVRLAANRINVVAVRAESLVGLSTRADRTVEVLPNK